MSLRRLIFVLVILCGLARAQTHLPAHCVDDLCSRTGIIVQAGRVRAAIPGVHWVRLKWSGSTGATSYNLYRGAVTGGPYSQVNTSPVTLQGWADLDVLPATNYFYVATAVNGGGESGNSSEVEVSIP